MRLLDANANRAREALRVIEDYARFVRDDDTLCAELKTLRHDLAAALSGVVAEAIFHRDTPGDVGTDNKTPAELKRDDVAHVVTAAGKRLGEALRVLEEFSKILHNTPDAGAIPAWEGEAPAWEGEAPAWEGEAPAEPKGGDARANTARPEPRPPIARQIETIRYRFYDIEHRIAFSLRPAGRFDRVYLYVLITQSACRRPWLETAEQAILGGADCLQLREKDLSGGEFLARARQFVALCKQHNVLSIINDRPDIAILSGADGVHVGQEDLPAREVRKIVGTEKLIGVSTHRIEQARQAVLDGADYIGVGPFFKSATKPRDFVAGPEYARQVAQQIEIPAVAIAGINEANVDGVLATGVKRIAVTAAVTAAEDSRIAALRLKARIRTTENTEDTEKKTKWV